MAQLIVLKSPYFEEWYLSQTPKIRSLIKSRVIHLMIGHFGDHKRFEGLIELRWKNGLRIYSFILDKTTIVILNGGNKNGQNFDIKKAKKIKEDILDRL